MDGMYAGFAAVRRPGAKTGHGRTAFFWRFVLPNSFSSAFAASCRRDRYPVFTIGTVRRPGKNSMKPCEIDIRLWDKRGQFCDEVQRIEYDVHGCTNAEKRMDARERPHVSCHHCRVS